MFVVDLMFVNNSRAQQSVHLNAQEKQKVELGNTISKPIRQPEICQDKFEQVSKGKIHVYFSV